MFLKKKSVMYKAFSWKVVTLFVFMISFITKTAESADPYAIISEKNLFRPDRTEWVIEEQDEKMVDKKIDPSKLELFGTIIIGDKKSALIHDKKAKKGKAKKGAGKNKAELYSLGDYIGGYILSAIDEKRVVLDYYGEKVTLYLHEGKEPPKGDFTPLTEVKPKPKETQEKAKKGKDKSKLKKKLASGKIPEALAKSPFMSQENMKKVLEFNKEIMEELKESGGTFDQETIKDKVEKFRDKFMDEMGAMGEMGQ